MPGIQRYQHDCWKVYPRARASTFFPLLGPQANIIPLVNYLNVTLSLQIRNLRASPKLSCCLAECYCIFSLLLCCWIGSFGLPAMG